MIVQVRLLPICRSVLTDQILDPAVASRLDLPIQLKLEIVVLIGCDDVATLLAVGFLLYTLQDAICHGPTFRREVGLSKAAPA